MLARSFLFLPLLAVPALAQSPIPQTAPRAHWVASTLTTQLPIQVRENQGAASTDKMYVFGGRNGNANTNTHNHLYEFDGTAWTLKTADGAAGSPPRRGGAAVAWNFASNKLVVFGGQSGSSASPAVTYNDTWEWDPVTNAWANVTPSGVSPSPRQLMNIAWDPITGGMLLFGGNSGVVEGDTWLFIGGVWVQVGSAGTGTPAPRQQAAVMTRSNPEFRDVVMCGGQGGGVHFLDIWRWDGAAWVLINPTTSAIPPAVVANQGVYDPLRKRVILQGGNGIPTAQVPGYNAQPSGWCGEFDCVTNEWFLYGGATPGTSDPVIGKCSRYFAAFVPALGKVYKVSGQANTNAMAMATYEYQSDFVGTYDSFAGGCAGPAGTPALVARHGPWIGETMVVDVTHLDPAAFAFLLFGFSNTAWTAGPLPTPVSLLYPNTGAGCNLLVSPDSLSFLANVGGTATWNFAIPNNPIYLGNTFFNQAGQLELSGGISVSNGSRAAIGVR